MCRIIDTLLFINLLIMKRWYEPYNLRAKKTFSFISFALLAAITITLLLTSLYYDFCMQHVSKTVTDVIDYTAYYFFGGTLFLLLMKRIPKSKPLSKKITIKEFISLLSVSVLFLFLGNYFGSFILDIIDKIFSVTQSPVVDSIIGDVPIYIELPCIVFIGPFFEELIFRKTIIDSSRKYGSKEAIIFSAVCFGIFHGNFEQLFYALFVGLILGYIYEKYGKVIYTFIIHALINFFGSYVVIWVTNGLDAESIEELIISGNLSAVPYYAYSLIILALLIYGFIYFIRNNRNISFEIENHVSSKTVFINKGFIAFFIFSLAECISILLLY